MSDRVSKTILLCEDRPQASLVRSFMDCCRLSTKRPHLTPIIASEQEYGGNVDWVLREYPKQLKACRQRHLAHAATLLIVVLDADRFEVSDRQRDLGGSLEQAGQDKLREDDPTVILIPRRHIETWIRAALGQTVNEKDDYKRPEPKKAEVRDAARQIHGWARDNPKPGPTCVSSLRAALPEWRKIG